jgi:hypothetical protein
VKLLFNWHGTAVTLAFENHTEFVTATTVIDCSNGRQAGEIEALRQTDKFFGELYQSLSSLNAAIDEVDACVRVREFLYDNVWERFQAEILEVARRRKLQFGSQIADFRGLIIGTHYPSRDPHHAKDLGEPAFAAPFSRPGTDADQNIGDKRRGGMSDVDFGSLLKVLNCGISTDTEITVSRFLDDRALYATALGEQSGLEQQSASVPLCYLMFEDCANRWQLGRLVNRINFAGTYRVVAAMHFEALREVGGVLLRAGTRLENALGRSLDDRDGDEEAIKDLRQLVRADYQAVEAPLAELPSKDVDGPIYARIERSRFYVSQFRHLAGALRIRRVDGFQQYDEFVLQKIGPVYEYIDRLGRRYSQVQKDRSLLLRRLQALDALYEERVISKAQRVADVALLCILGPYYFGSLAAHVAEHLAPRLEWMVWLSVGAFAALQSLWQIRITRLSRRKLGREALRHPVSLARRLLLGGLISIAIMIAVWLLGGDPRVHQPEPATRSPREKASQAPVVPQAQRPIPRRSVPAPHRTNR